MYDDPETARKVILESITALDKVQRSRPGSLNLQVFFNSKSGELINLFSQAPDTRQKNTAVNILKRLDLSMLQNMTTFFSIFAIC